MRSPRHSAIRFGYLAVSLFGWLLFGVFLRAELDLLGAGSIDPVASLALALYGAILLVGTPIGYAVIRAEKSGGLSSPERR